MNMRRRANGYQRNYGPRQIPRGTTHQGGGPKMSKKKDVTDNLTLPVKSEFLLYQTEDGQTRIYVRLQDDTVWMTQAAMAELYQTTP